MAEAFVEEEIRKEIIIGIVFLLQGIGWMILYFISPKKDDNSE